MRSFIHMISNLYDNLMKYWCHFTYKKWSLRGVKGLTGSEWQDRIQIQGRLTLMSHTLSNAYCSPALPTSDAPSKRPNKYTHISNKHLKEISAITTVFSLHSIWSVSERDYLVHSQQFPKSSLHCPGAQAKKKCRSRNFGSSQLKHTPKDWEIIIVYY